MSEGIPVKEARGASLHRQRWKEPVAGGGLSVACHPHIHQDDADTTPTDLLHRSSPV